MADISRFITAGDVIARAAVECGLTKSADPYGSIDPSYVQLVGLLSSCGEELMYKAEWQVLIREWGFVTQVGHQNLGYSALTGVFVVGEEVTGVTSGARAYIVTDAVGVMNVTSVYGSFTVSEVLLGSESGATATLDSKAVVTSDTGTYTLPTDFGYMIPQTGWERTNDSPLGGPLTSQQWQYLNGRVATSISVAFRYQDNMLKLYPQPPADGLDINMEYISRNWLLKSGGGYRDTVQANDDVVLYPPILVIKMLRAKFLASKGFDTTRADQEYDEVYETFLGKDKSSRILNVGASRGGRYVSVCNTPSTGYGD